MIPENLEVVSKWVGIGVFAWIGIVFAVRVWEGLSAAITVKEKLNEYRKMLDEYAKSVWDYKRYVDDFKKYAEEFKKQNPLKKTDE